MKKELKAGGQTVALLIDAAEAPIGVDPVTSPESPLQMLVMKQKAGYVVAKHAHKAMDRVTTTRQKAVVVLSGSVDAVVCDEAGINGDACTIGPGQCLIQLSGGYALTVKEDATFYEFKNGPHVEDKIMLL